MDVERVAAEMLAECQQVGQSSRRLDRLDDGTELRAALRTLARADHTHVRTALIDDVVVVARTDADIWHDDATTMRRKLTPPD